MAVQERELSPCACGCGELVPGTWKRGHVKRGIGGYQRQFQAGSDGMVTPIPGPDQLEAMLAEGEDVGLLDIGDEIPSGPEPPRRPKAAPPPPPEEPTGPPPISGEPPWVKREWRDKARGRAKAPKVTAGIKTDINAKISFVLEIPGRIWEARDPVCGGTFVAQRADISVALTEIVCQSSDLVAWFTGSGGAFMLWLNLAAAFWPVLMVIMAHHVYHTVKLAEPGEQPEPQDFRAYAA